MPLKTEVQIKAEISAKLKRLFDLGDTVGMADLFEEVFENYLPTEKEEKSNDIEAKTLKDEFAKLLRTEDKKKGAKMTLDLRDELAKRKVKHIIEASPVLDDFEAKIKNHEIPEAEVYVDDQKAVEKLAIIATIGSKSFNMVKVDESASSIVANAIRDVDIDENGELINSGFSDAYEDELASRQSLEEVTNKVWEDSGLAPEKIDKIRSSLDRNVVDPISYYDFYYNDYYVEGSPVFKTVSEKSTQYLNYEDERFEKRISDIENQVRNEAASKAKNDTYIEYFEATQKLSQILKLQKDLIIPMRISLIGNAQQKQKAEKLLYEPMSGLIDPDEIIKMTPAQYSEKLDEAIAGMEKNIKEQEAYASISKNISDISHDIAIDKINGSVVSAILSDKPVEKITNDTNQAIEESHNKDIESSNENLILACQKDLLDNLKQWNEKLKGFNNESVKEIKDEPFSANIDRKYKERREYLDQTEIVPDSLEYIKLKEELAERKRIKNAGDKITGYLESDLKSIEEYPWLACTSSLIEAKLSANGGRVTKAKENAINGFFSKLAEKNYFEKGNEKFISLLGKDLNERQNEAEKSFKKKVQDIKSDILSGKVPGVFPTSEEMARAIASDIAYHTTDEGKVLKAIHDTKKQIIGTLSNGKGWKSYIANHNGDKTEKDLSTLYHVQKNIGYEAKKFGYTVTDDITKQIPGTVFDKMPYKFGRIATADNIDLFNMRNSYIGKLNDIELYDSVIGNMTDYAKSILEVLNETNKKDHKNSKTYNKMVGDLEKIAKLGDSEKRLEISTEEVDALIGNLKESSEAYEKEHTGMFIGKSKGFGKTRLNVSKTLKAFADASVNQLSNHKQMLTPDRPIKAQRTELEQSINAIDKTALEKGYGAYIRKQIDPQVSKLEEFINNATAHQHVKNGSTHYDNAIHAAHELKKALENGNASEIENAGKTLKERLNDYLDYKRKQTFDGKMPNAKGQQRINAMTDLHLAGGSAVEYAKNLAAVNKDKQTLPEYEKAVQQEKENIIRKTELEQQQIDLDNKDIFQAQVNLKKMGIDKMISENAAIYNKRNANSSIKGIDKVSAGAAYDAFNTLCILGNSGTLDKESIQEAKESIAQLVVDKMIQLDHGKTIHKKLGNMNEEQVKQQLSEKAKELAKSPAFEAAVPKNINSTYIKKFLADYEGNGIMQVKNSIESYRKAVRNINQNVEKATAKNSSKVIETNLGKKV